MTAEELCPRSDLPPRSCAHCRGSVEVRPRTVPRVRDAVSDLEVPDGRSRQVVLLVQAECGGCARLLSVGELVTVLPDGDVFCELCLTA